MRYFFLACMVLLATGQSFAQINLRATADGGSGYPAIRAAGLDFEDPDCVHTSFGPHVTQAPDDLLNRNVFLFHSHIDEDNDRCEVFDRARMEIKGGPNTNAESQHVEDATSYYRWKFKIAADFVGTSSFNHLFQNKHKGPDGSFPVITLTARASVLQVIHNGGDTGNDLGTVAQVSLDLLRGRWVEVYMRQVHSENGQFEVNIRDLSTGETILNYENNNIDLWRAGGGEYNRPKWGIYRRKSSVLKDEIVRFADFCISETSAELCPPEPTLIVDTEAPSTPTNLRASDIMITSVQLDWDASTDNVGIASYRVLQDGTEVWSGTDLSTTITGLMGNTTYQFVVLAVDEAANRSAASNEITVTTTDPTAPPGVAGILSPGNGATNQPVSSLLRWSAASNAVSYNVYFGTTNTPALVSSSQNGLTFNPELTFTTEYFWRIGAVNANGETLSPVWSFTTGEDNPDLPWSVFRGNARPEVETNFWELNNAPDNPTIDDVVSDPRVAGNQFYRFQDDSDENFRWRYRFVASDTTLTVVTRFKAISSGTDNVISLETRGFGFREKIRIDQEQMTFEQAVPPLTVDLPFDPADEFHVIRITMKGPNLTVYLDENPEPFATSVTARENESRFFEFGKSGSQQYGAMLDWVSIVINEELAPGEGAPLPSDLVLSSDANLSSLLVNGSPIEGFDPDVTEYFVEASANDPLPVLTFTTASRLANADLVMPATVPNSAASIIVSAQDGINDKVYVVRFEAPVATRNDALGTSLQLFPNPVRDELTVALEVAQGAVAGAIKVADAYGRVLRSQPFTDGATVNLAGLPQGVLLVTVSLADGRSATRKIVRLP